MALVLHDYWRSSAGYRVRIALNLKRASYDRVAVDLIGGAQGSAANVAVNPQGLVPTLLVDGVPLTQSLAIIDWLDRTYPDPPLYPANPMARARTLAMALAVVADIHPIDNLRVLRRLEAQFGADQPAKDDWYRHWVTTGLDALEAMARTAAGSADRRGTAGPFLGGSAPDLADVCLVPQLYNARRFAVPLGGWPRLVAAEAACTDLPAFAAAHPDRFTP